MISQPRLLFILGAIMVFAACGGGGQSSSHAAPAAAPTTGASPNAFLRLTIVPSNLRHGTRRSAKKVATRNTGAFKRAPQFVDGTPGANVQINFYTYNPVNGYSYNSAPSTSASIVVATPGPTTATVAVFSGPGYAYATEYDTDNSTPLASNSGPGPSFYNLDPGTTEALSLTLSLVPSPNGAFAYISFDPFLESAYEANNDTCFDVGGSTSQTVLFTVVPADNEGNYSPIAPAETSGQTPPPLGINGTVTLTGNPTLTASDTGGTSTVAATGATWNGYTVYSFTYTPIGQGDSFAPTISATATAYDPSQNQQVTENVTLGGNNGCDF